MTGVSSISTSNRPLNFSFVVSNKPVFFLRSLKSSVSTSILFIFRAVTKSCVSKLTSKKSVSELCNFRKSSTKKVVVYHYEDTKINLFADSKTVTPASYG